MKFYIMHEVSGEINYITVDLYPRIKEIVMFGWRDLDSALSTSHERTIGMWKIKKLK